MSFSIKDYSLITEYHATTKIYTKKYSMIENKTQRATQVMSAIQIPPHTESLLNVSHHIIENIGKRWD